MTEWASYSVQRLIADHLSSVGQLEVLLLLAKEPTRRWTALAAADELRTAEPAVRKWLDEFRVHGLVTRCTGAPPEYRFEPANPSDAEAVKELAHLYRSSFRSRVIDLIYTGNIRSIADAFRLRRKP